MFIRFVCLFFVGFLINVSTTAVPEQTVMLPQSLVDELLKKAKELDTVKELLEATNVTANPETPLLLQPKRKSMLPKIASVAKKLLLKLKMRRQKKNSTSVPGQPLPKKIERFMSNFDEVLANVEEAVNVGKEIKSTAWDLLQEMLKEDE